jgi:hypothetical protein
LSNTRVRLREVKADMIGYTSELIAKAIDQRQLDTVHGRRQTEVRELSREPRIPSMRRPTSKGV